MSLQDDISASMRAISLASPTLFLLLFYAWAKEKGLVKLTVGVHENAWGFNLKPSAPDE